MTSYSSLSVKKRFWPTVPPWSNDGIGLILNLSSLSSTTALKILEAPDDTPTRIIYISQVIRPVISLTTNIIRPVMFI